MNMKELKLETLGPEKPKSTSLSQMGKAERAIKLSRKTAIKNLKNRLSNPGSGESGLRAWSRVDSNASKYNRFRGWTTFDYIFLVIPQKVISCSTVR